MSLDLLCRIARLFPTSKDPQIYKGSFSFILANLIQGLCWNFSGCTSRLNQGLHVYTVQDREHPSPVVRCSRRKWPGTELIVAGVISAREKNNSELERPWVTKKTKDFKKWGGRRWGRITQDPRLGWVWISSWLKFTPDWSHREGRDLRGWDLQAQ